MPPSDTDYQKLKWLLERLHNSEEWAEPYFERAKRHYQLYRFGSAVKETDWPYVNRVRSRDILAFVEDSTAIMISTLFASMPFYSIIPRETRLLYTMYGDGIDTMAIGDQLSRVLDYQVSHEEMEYFDEMVDMFKMGCILGNGYEGVYPKFDSRGIYLRPLLKTHDFWDVLPIAGSKRITKSPGVFVREFTSLEELRSANVAGQPTYRNLEQVGRGSSEVDPSKQWHRALLQEVGMENYSIENDDMELIHYFSGGHVITIANRKAIIRDSGEEGTYDKMKQPFPYDLPLVQYKYMPVPLEFFGMGIPEVLEVLQEDKNLIDSARRDNIDLVINKILLARSGADINFDLIKYYAGAIWPMENPQSDIVPMEMSDVTQSSYAEAARRTSEMENALSLFGYARGMTPQHSEQPTTIMKLQQASLNRLDLAVKLAEFNTLQNIATRIIMLTRRYMPQSIYESIAGDVDAGFYKLTEEDIRRFFFFKPIGSSVSNIREVRQQQMTMAFQLLAGLQPQHTMMNIRPFTVDWYEASKTALDAIDIKNVDRILVQVSQNPMGNMGQMQGMMGQGQGGQGEMGGVQGGSMAVPSSEMNELSSVLYGGGQ